MKPTDTNTDVNVALPDDDGDLLSYDDRAALLDLEIAIRKKKLLPTQQQRWETERNLRSIARGWKRAAKKYKELLEKEQAK